MAWELTDSFLTKEEAEKDCCLVALVSEYILEVSPRMPMLSQGETSGVLRASRETLPPLSYSSVSLNELSMDDFLYDDCDVEDRPVDVLELPLRKDE